MANPEYHHCPVCGGRLTYCIPNHETVEQPVCTDCGYVFYLDPKVAAGTIPVIDGHLVLLRRAINPSKGLWVFPGGYVNRGEHVEEAAQRETHEEVGLDVKCGELVGVYSYTDTSIVVIVYEAWEIAGELAPGIEAQEVRLFRPDELPWNELAFPSTRHALTDWVARHAVDSLPTDY